MDDSRRSYVEDRSQKEDTGVEHRQNIETDRGATRQKAFSLGLSLFATRNTVLSQFNGKEAPPIGGFILLGEIPNLRLCADLLVGRP